MRLPEPLQAALDRILSTASPTSLRKAREALTRQYREEKDSAAIFSAEAKRLAYLAVRFPATYSAVSKVLGALKEQVPSFVCKRLLDIGAGPGTATWAALELFPEIEAVSLFEKSQAAIALGKELSQGVEKERREEWLSGDLEQPMAFPSVDLAIASYSLGELRKPEALIERMWAGGPSYLAIVEPGTPRGYRLILSARDLLLKRGAHLVAPCPHATRCPLSGADWCHFSTRLERTSLHRLLKEGALGYEDEKYSFLIASKVPLAGTPSARILRHPQKGSGHVRLVLCQPDGQRKEVIISKKMKEFYKKARNAEWGDSFP